MRPSRTFLLWLIGATVSFPIEHYVWHHVPPFIWITKMLGM